MSSLLNFASAGLSVAEARRAVSWVAVRVSQAEHQPTGLVALPLRKEYLRVSEEMSVTQSHSRAWPAGTLVLQ